MKSFDVIIIGGGVAGLSSAMQLAKSGASCLVLEKSMLGSGSTGSAAGLLGQLRSSRVDTKMLMDGIGIVRELETDTPIFVQTGSLRIAQTNARAREIRQHALLGKSIGFDVNLIDNKELSILAPYMNVDDVVEACYSPTDGHILPSELATAYFQTAKKLGVEFRTQVKVEGVSTEHGKVTGVRTSTENYSANAVLICAGLWSNLVTRALGFEIMTAPLAHYYITTDPLSDFPIDPKSPSIRDKDSKIYTRPEVGGLLVGMFEEEPELYRPEQLPDDFEMSGLSGTVSRADIKVALLIEAARQRFPFFERNPTFRVTKGLIGYTPDDQPLCGPLDQIDGLFLCTGFSHGIVQSPTIGIVMAELMLNGKCRYDVSNMNPNRFDNDPNFLDTARIAQACFNTSSQYYGAVKHVH